MSGARILVADDKENILKLFRRLLPPDWELTLADDGTRALALLAVSEFDVVVTDLRMPGADGMAVLREARRLHPDTEVVLMTAFGSVRDAVDAMKEGAYDYLTKPFEPDEALLVLERALERRRLREQARNLARALDGARGAGDIIGKGPAMGKVLGLVARAGEATATVLITGESGTGKEVVARAIHRSGPRRERPFVPINCGAIPETLIESELFGHVRGAFTGATADRRGLFEEADGGTLFLDEIGELPSPMQVKLTRVLQERTIRRVGAGDERRVDVRIIAATNRDLKEAVTQGRFREDLLYRLNVLPVALPPLRDRREDIPALAAHFLVRHGTGRRTPAEGFTPEALSALLRHSWPGNVRELENVVERALIVSDGPRIGVEALPEEVAQLPSGGGRGRPAAAPVTALSFKEAVDLARDRASREYLVALMREFHGNVTQAAERAGVERESLHRLLKRHGLQSDDFK